MGNAQGQGYRRVTLSEAKLLNSFPDGLSAELRDRLSDSCLSRYSIFSPEDPDKADVIRKYDTATYDSPQEDRALGCFIGMISGDSLGAPLEFSNIRYGSTELQGMHHEEIWYSSRYNRFRLRPGQWTDDSAMGLCLADSLVTHKKFAGHDVRLRFLNWWELGYNNAFGYEKTSPRSAATAAAESTSEKTEQRVSETGEAYLEAGSRSSVGLGGNISLSFSEFKKNRSEFTTAGDRFTSGNGSIMRNAPVPVFGHDDVEAAMQLGAMQSKTTHQGDEAAECCRLLTFVCVKAFYMDGEEAQDRKIRLLQNIPAMGFSSELYSMQCLAASKQEEENETNKSFKMEDRNWNWKDREFRYSPSRSREQPGYIGSYAMDNLAMSLHCVWTTDSFAAAVLKAANLRGDSDSVASVAGQIAGAIYGLSNLPRDYYDTIRLWDNNGDTLLKAYKLFHHKGIN